MAKEIKNNKKVRYYTKWNDHLYMALVHVLCAVSVVCILVPLIFVVAASFSSPKALLSGKVYLWPVDFTLRGYNMLLGHKLLISGFLNSILYTVVGTVINVVMTVLAAYPLSRRDLAIRNPVMFLFTFTMLFSGGMIPSYMLVKNLHMLDTIWAVVMPTALSVWNLIITRTYFQSTIPQEILDSASVDGCDDFKFLIKICIPLADPGGERAAVRGRALELLLQRDDVPEHHHQVPPPAGHEGDPDEHEHGGHVHGRDEAA